MTNEKEQPEQKSRRNIVKDVFDKPKKASKEISSLFTHFKSGSKRKTRRQPRLLSPGFHFLPLAIDIGTSGIKLLQLAENKKGKIEIAGIDEEKYERDVPRGSDEVLRQCLKQLLDRNKFNSECLATLFAKDFQGYNMMFPDIPETELNSAVRYKIIQLKPFGMKINDIVYQYLRWDPIIKKKKSEQIRIFVICIPKKILEERIQLFQSMGLNTQSLETPSLCLTHLAKYYRAKELNDEVTLWLDIGKDESFLTIERGGAVYFSRSLKVTSGQMTEEIARSSRMDKNQAEEIKCRHGLIFWTTHVKQKNTSALPTPGRDPSALVYYGINSILENLVIDIEHTFKYFSYQVSQSQITKFDRVLLSGGGVNLLYLDQFLSERFGVPVERVDPFRMFSLAAIMQSQNLDFPSIQSGFAVCAGLALGQKTKDQSRVNFIPKKELTRRQEIFQTMMKAPVLAFAAMVIIMISLTVYNAGLLRHYQTKTKGVSLDAKRSKMILGKEQSHQMKADQKEAELINRREMLRARRDFLKSAFREPKDFSKALNDLSLVVPDNIRLTKLKYEGIRMMLTGETDQLESVGDLISSIKSLGSFESAEYEYSRHEPETNNYIFEIIVKVRL